jgi:hypothetical protein
MAVNWNVDYAERSLNMEKRVLLSTSATSLTLTALGLLTVIIVSIGRLNMNGVVFGGVILLLAASLLLAAAAWVGGLMLAARLQRWDWLVGVLLLGPVGALLFCLVPAHEPAAA